MIKLIVPPVSVTSISHPRRSCLPLCVTVVELQECYPYAVLKLLHHVFHYCFTIYGSSTGNWTLDHSLACMLNI